MKLIKPFQLSHTLSHKSFSGSHYELHTVLLGWDLITGDTRAETDIWKAVGPLVELQIPLDEFSPKNNPEFFVFGSFYSPVGREVEAGYVEVQVGDTHKRLNVFGERVWKKTFGAATTFSDPIPFSSIPIIWQNAFGSPEYPLNALGLGEKEDDEVGVHYLPRVELESDLVTSPNSRPVPGSFLPLSTQDPRRTRHVGSYGKEWEVKFYPGYPKDFDVSFFNRAPEDQHLGKALSAPTSFRIENMHPTRQELIGNTPDFKVRVFVDRVEQDQREFNEVQMVPDTAWFFPDAELGVLVFHGSAQTTAHDRAGIRNIITGYERTQDSERGVEHYRKALEVRVNDQKKEVALLMQPVDLIPKGEKTLIAIFEQPEDETLRMFAVDKAQERIKKDVSRTLDELEQNLAQKKVNLHHASDEARAKLEKLLKEQQKMIDNHRHTIATGEYTDLPEKEAKLVELSKQLTPRRPDGSLDIEKFDITVADQIFELTAPDEAAEPPDHKTLIRDNFDSVKEDIIALDDGKDNAVKTQSLEELQKIRNAFEEGFKQPITVPYPRPPALAGLKAIEDQLTNITQDTMDKFETETAKIQIDEEARKSEEFVNSMAATKANIASKELKDDELKSFREIQAKLEEVAEKGDDGWRKGYVRYAHKLVGHVPPRGLEGQVLMAELRGLEASDAKVLTVQDFAGLTAEREVIVGVDFSWSFFEKSRWVHAEVKNCNLSYTVLAHAEISNSHFVDCDFDYSTLGGAILDDCVFENCTFHHAIFDEVVITGATFRNCKFFFGNQSGFKCKKSIFEGCSVEGINFFKGEFADVNWIETEFERVFFVEGFLKKNIFEKCSLKSVLFSTLSMSAGRFLKSSLSKVAFHENISIIQTEFRELDLFIVNFRGLQLKQSVFTKLTGSLTDFSNATLEDSAWIDVDLDGSRFHYANLKESVFENCRLIDAVMQDADLRDCRFTKCNLFAGDFLNAQIGGAHFSECNLDRSLLEDWSP